MNEDKAVTIKWESWEGIHVALGFKDFHLSPLPESKGLEVKEVNKWAGKDIP